MPVLLEVFDPATSAKIFDIGSSAGRMLGTLTGQAATGSHVDARLSEGIPWAVAYVGTLGTGLFRTMSHHNTVGSITFSGTTMNWSLSGKYLSQNQASASSFTIVYGVR